MEQGFAGLHPRLCIAYFIVIMCACMLIKHPLYLIVTFVAVVLLNLSIDGGRAMKKGIGAYLLMAALIVLLNPLFSSRGATILFYAFERPVTLESIVYGALFALSLVSVLISFTAYQLVVTPDKLLYLLSPIAPRSAFVITVTLRFMPLLIRRLKEIMTIQRILGYWHSQAGKKQLMREGMETLHTLITWSLEEALQTAGSMRARGYGTGPRSSAAVYTMDRRDRSMMWLMVFAGAHLAIGGFYGVNRYEVYPRLAAWEWSLHGIVHLLLYTVFLLIPVVLNGREWLYWRFIRSRM